MDESDNVLQSSEAVGVCVEDRVQQIVFQDSGNEVTMWSVVVSVVRYRVEYMDWCRGVLHSLSSSRDMKLLFEHFSVSGGSNTLRLLP